jgi:SAM-dependent methyltransferase
MDEIGRPRIRAYYAALGEREWGRLEQPADGAVEFAVTTDVLARHLPARSNILDIGGGPGRYAIWFAQRGHTVALGDLSPELLAIVRRRVDDAGVSDRISEIVVGAELVLLALTAGLNLALELDGKPDGGWPSLEVLRDTLFTKVADLHVLAEARTQVEAKYLPASPPSSRRRGKPGATSSTAPGPWR